jgi:anti-anti-sigma regulatory factor
VTAKYSALNLVDERLFGVKLEGALGRADKSRLRELAARCLEKGKIDLVFDLSGVEALGGGGAATLAELQRSLLERGGQVVFVGASDTVRRFLARSFGDLPLACCRDIEGAVTIFEARWEDDDLFTDREPGAASVAGDGADSRLDDLLASFNLRDAEAEEAVGDAAPAEPAGVDDRAGADAPAVAEDEGSGRDRQATEPAPVPAGPDGLEEAIPTARRGAPEATAPELENGTGRFLSLQEAARTLRLPDDPAAFGDLFLQLLRGHDLAATGFYCYLDGDRFRASEGPFEFPADGGLVRKLKGHCRPLTLLDIDVEELEEDEALALGELRPDLILPLIWDDELQAVAFLQRGKDDHEYDVSEVFALELLMRFVRDDGRGVLADGPAAEPPREVPAAAGPVACQGPDPDATAVEQLVRCLANVEDENGFWGTMVAVLPSALKTDIFVHWDADAGRYVRPVSLGTADLDLRLPPRDAGGAWAALDALELPLPENEWPESLGETGQIWRQRGVQILAPLRCGRHMLGLLWLGRAEGGAVRPEDVEHLAEMLQPAMPVLRALRSQRLADERQVAVLQTVISQIERRHLGCGDLTARMVPYLRRFSALVGLSADQQRELVLGALLRDVGLIQLEDICLSAPEKLSQAQWRMLKSHPETGMKILEPLHLSQGMRDIVLHHHERFNGDGYPGGLCGREIPLLARIVAIVENYVALITDMGSREAMASEEAAEVLWENLGGRYDPELMEIFMRMIAPKARGAARATSRPAAPARSLAHT